MLSESQYLSGAIKWRYYSGAVVIGVAEGCRFLGQKFWTTGPEPILQNGFSIVPIVVNTGINEAETLAVAKQNGFGTVAMHIPRGSGLIFNTDGHLEAVGKSLVSEIHNRYEDGEPAVTNYLAPPETGDGILTRMKQLQSRILKKPCLPITEFIDDPDCNIDEGSDEIHVVESDELRQIGTEAFLKEDYSEALTLYEKSLKKNCKSIGASMNITLCLLRLGKYADALVSADYTLTLPGSRNNAKCWYRRASVFKALSAQLPSLQQELTYQRKCDLTLARTISLTDSMIAAELEDVGDLATPDLPINFLSPDEACLFKVRVRDERITTLGDSVVKNGGLHLLDLTECSLGDSGVTKLFLNQNIITNVTKLNISGNDISDKVMEVVLNELPNSSIKDLNLSRNNLSFQSISMIANNLRTPSNLEAINLSSQRPRLTAVSLWRLVPILFIDDTNMKDIYVDGMALTAASKQRLYSLQQAATNRCYIHCESAKARDCRQR
eukprot:TRINITY_DN30720_c0_g1_i1.p1 TRINITY_DN30720_c0_g1~~TRINITY_DN30720_c0_g1_i1.p1  ORF type:complete len:528 (+),score=81.57 TRINITY_DN30720_c0_g1_i1:98-1585(+)